MHVYATFDPSNPHPLTRLWLVSWEARGWKPRLIFPGEAPPKVRGKLRKSTLSEINFSLTTRGKHSRGAGRTLTFADNTSEAGVLRAGLRYEP